MVLRGCSLGCSFWGAFLMHCSSVLLLDQNSKGMFLEEVSWLPSSHPAGKLKGFLFKSALPLMRWVWDWFLGIISSRCSLPKPAPYHPFKITHLSVLIFHQFKSCGLMNWENEQNWGYLRDLISIRHTSCMSATRSFYWLSTTFLFVHYSVTLERGIQTSPRL